MNSANIHTHTLLSGLLTGEPDSKSETDQHQRDVWMDTHQPEFPRLSSGMGGRALPQELPRSVEEMIWFMGLNFSIFKMGLGEEEDWRGRLATVSGHFQC